jgi:DNA-binding NarL/FixJ family response regulator
MPIDVHRAEFFSSGQSPEQMVRGAGVSIKGPIRILVADSHALVLDGLERLFLNARDFCLVERCSDGSAALEEIVRHVPDVAVLSLRLPVRDGISVARELQAANLSTRVVLYTTEIGERQMIEALSAGVRGIVLKDMNPELLVQCARKVHSGEQWLERGVTRLALDSMIRRSASGSVAAKLLTKQEMRVLRMVIEGLPNSEIATNLFIGVGTVKVHLHNIYTKLQLKNRLSLLRFAQENGLLN